MIKETTIYDFKTNMSKYIAAVEAGEYEKIIVKRRDKIVGEFVSLPVKPRANKISWGMWEGQMSKEQIDAAFDPAFESEIAAEWDDSDERTL